MTWKIVITPTALAAIEQIADRRIRRKISERIDSLQNDPDKQGKALLGELSGFRSLRAVGQRYRVIYQVQGSKVVVLVAAVGIRKDGSKKDIYELAKKLIRLRLLE